jgi:hypothetical protein
MQNFGGNKRRVRLKCRKSAVILPEERGYMEEERGYIPGRVRLYYWKSTVIFPEERGYIPGRARLYFCYENNDHLHFCLQPRAAHTLHSDQNSLCQCKGRG